MRPVTASPIRLWRVNPRGHRSVFSDVIQLPRVSYREGEL
jgi:hypothetical protein